MQDYCAYGLRVHSEVAFPELIEASGEADVRICCGRLDTPWQEPEDAERSFQETAEGTLLSWNRFARFLVRGGNEILVERAPRGDVEESVIRHLILGPVFAELHNQRGNAVFHASAVALDKGGVAFMAGKGYGKSTQAAAFTQRGFPLITDDLLVLRCEGKQVLANPGVPFLKLWPASMELIGENPADHPQVKTYMEKRALPMKEVLAQAPVTMQAIFLLEVGERIEIEPVEKKEAFLRLAQNWYGALFEGEMLPIFGILRQFQDCSAMIDRLPVFRVRRPDAMHLVPEIARRIEQML